MTDSSDDDSFYSVDSSMETLDSVAPEQVVNDSRAAEDPTDDEVDLPQRMTLTEFLQLISSRGSLERARIQSVQCYEVDDGAHHRFLLFYCIPQSRSSVWFRVDRQRQRHLSLEVPLLNRGCVDTHDTVIFATSKAELLRGQHCRQENELSFEKSPSLGSFGFLVEIILQEMIKYTPWPENCWLLCSLLQEQLREASYGKYTHGSPVMPNIAPSIRSQIKIRLYHEPDPPPQTDKLLHLIIHEHELGATANIFKSLISLARKTPHFPPLQSELRNSAQTNELAGALYNFAQHEQSLHATARRLISARSMGIFRHLYQFNPEEYYNPFSRSLLAYASHLRACGRDPESLHFHKEASEVYARHHRDPDSVDEQAKTTGVERINDVLSDPGGPLKSGQGHGPTASQTRDYTLHLSQLPGLQGRPIDSVKGREAEELGRQLHSYLTSCSNPTEYATVLRLLQDLCSSSGRLPSSYKLANVDFDRGDLIGRGGEACVYGGYFNGQRVVVREVTMPPHFWRSQPGRDTVKLILREVITHSQLAHPNIIPLLGVFYARSDGPPLLVLPCAEKGSLSDLIRAEAIRDIEFAWITTGTGRALEYLHSRRPPIFHGDLHTDNVLIDASGNALLSDFGLSRIRHEVTRTHTNIREGGRTRFMAPELLAGDELFRTSPASDIFSLSMTFWNVWTRELPFAELLNERKVEAAIRGGQRPNCPTRATNITAVLMAPPDMEQFDEHSDLDRNFLSPEIEQDFWLLLVDMWAHEASNRPSSADVLQRLETIFLSLLEQHDQLLQLRNYIY